MILATDLTKHFHLVTRFKQEFLGAHPAVPAQGLGADHRRDLVSFILKASDVGASCKPFNYHCQWTMRVLGEFFSQGDAERELKLPLSPFCDRYDTHICNSQAGFFEFVVMPQYSVLDEYLHSKEVSMQILPQIQRNIKFWKKWNGDDFCYQEPLSNTALLESAYAQWEADLAEREERLKVPIHRRLSNSGGQRRLSLNSTAIVPVNTADGDVESQEAPSPGPKASARQKSRSSLSSTVSN